MKRLTLEELKAQKNVIFELDLLKGGNAESCHCNCESMAGVTVCDGKDGNQRSVYIFGVDMTWLYGNDWYSF